MRTVFAAWTLEIRRRAGNLDEALFHLRSPKASGSLRLAHRMSRCLSRSGRAWRNASPRRPPAVTSTLFMQPERCCSFLGATLTAVASAGLEPASVDRLRRAHFRPEQDLTGPRTRGTTPTRVQARTRGAWPGAMPSAAGQDLSLSVGGALFCGALSGAWADTVTHPLSTIKTRLQVQGAARLSKSGEITVYRGAFHAFTSIVKGEGIGALYSGLGAVLLGAAPATGLYFVGYEAVKALAPENPAIHFAAGNIAQLCGSLAWVPMDVIKERCQIEGQLGSAGKAGTRNVIRTIVAKEGLRGLYRAYWMHQATWAPFNGVYQLVYEQAKSSLDAAGSPALTLASGVVAGVVASASTAPIDLVKTRLQVAARNPALFNYTGAWDALKKILRREGPRALFDGVGARVVWLTPRMTCAMTAYEFVKDRFLAPP